MANLALLDEIVKLYPADGPCDLPQENTRRDHIDASIAKVQAQHDREQELYKYFHQELILLESAEDAVHMKETREAAIASLINQEKQFRRDVVDGTANVQTAKKTNTDLARRYRSSCCINFIYHMRWSELSRLHQIKREYVREDGDEKREGKKQRLDFHIATNE
jgi:hypothetical protein